MSPPDNPPNDIPLGQEQKRKVTEIFDALQNLLYLIRLDAYQPAQVLTYADHFEMLLSEMQQLLSENSGRKANKTVLAGKAKVLLVEDDPAVAGTLALIFSNAGHETRTSGSAEHALAMLEAEAWVPQFTIIDVQLPGMNGLDLAARLKAQYPELRVSLFSGQTTPSDLLQEARRQGHHFQILPKPVPPTIFLEMAANLLREMGQKTDPIQ